MEEHKTPLEDKKVFKYSGGGTALYIFLCFVFIFIGFMMLNDDDVGYRIFGMASIIVFGGSVIGYLVILRKPFLIVSKEGLTKIRCGREMFVSWTEVSQVRSKLQNIYHPGFRTTFKYVGVYTFEGRKDDTSFKIFMTKLNKLATHWEEMPTLLIYNNNWLTGIECAEIIEIMEKYHAEFVSGLSEEDRPKYENIFCHTLTGKLNNNINFVGDDKSIQGNVNQENSDQENINAPPKVSDQIDWEKLSTKGR